LEQLKRITDAIHISVRITLSRLRGHHQVAAPDWLNIER
jgi:hypothetical protein